MDRYIYEQDPGHGWIGVPAAELVQLGIAGEVSSCSYYDRSRKIVWLEEDCDMSLFFTAKLAKQLSYIPRLDKSEAEHRHEVVTAFYRDHITERHVERTRIRQMPSFADYRERYANQARRAPG